MVALAVSRTVDLPPVPCVIYVVEHIFYIDLSVNSISVESIFYCFIEYI